MVSYQRWTALVFEQVPETVLEDPSEVQNVVKIAAEVWNDRKEELSPATVAEARDIARDEITVNA